MKKTIYFGFMINKIKDEWNKESDEYFNIRMTEREINTIIVTIQSIWVDCKE